MHGNGLIASGLASAVRSGRPDVDLRVVRARAAPEPAGRAAAAAARRRAGRQISPSCGCCAPSRRRLASPTRAPRELRERARERSGRRPGPPRSSSARRSTRCAAALDAETALLSYVFDGDALVVLVVTARARRARRARGWPASASALSGLRADLDMSASVAPAARRGRAVGARRAAATALARAARRRRSAIAGAQPHRPDRAGRARRHALGDASRRCADGLFTVAPSASRWVRRAAAPRAAAQSAGFAVGPRVARADEEVDARGRGVGTPTCCGRRGDGRRRHRARRATWTCCTSPPTAGMPSTTRCSPDSNSPTARCSATTSTSMPRVPHDGRAVGVRGRAARRCGGARRRSG